MSDRTSVTSDIVACVWGGFPPPSGGGISFFSFWDRYKTAARFGEGELQRPQTPQTPQTPQRGLKQLFDTLQLYSKVKITVDQTVARVGRVAPVTTLPIFVDGVFAL